MTINTQRKVDKIIDLLNKLSNEESQDIIHHCDTILADIFNAHNYGNTIIGYNLLNILCKSSDKDSVISTFEVLTGIKFSDYLDKCIEVISNQLNETSFIKDNLIKNGLTPDEADLLIDTYYDPIVINIYPSPADLGRKWVQSFTRITGAHFVDTINYSRIGMHWVKINDNYFIFPNGKIVEIKDWEEK